MQRRSSNSADVRLLKLDYDKIVNELRKYAKRLVLRSVKAVILTGPLTRVITQHYQMQT